MIERLGGEEQLMLDASRAWPQDIGALALLDGESLFDDRGQLRLDAIRDVIAARLHLVPRFRQVLRIPRRGRGGPYWVDARDFDLARHVTELRLEPPAGEDEVLTAVEELRARRFDRRRPLWGIWVLTGLKARRVAILVKIHHTVADGLAAMTIISALFDQVPNAEPAPPRPWSPSRWPTPSELVAENLRRRWEGTVRVVAALRRPWMLLAGLRAAWPATRELLAEQPGAKTGLDRIVGPGRTLTLVRSDALRLRKVARAHGATVNDILLAVTAAGIRKLLLHRGEPVDGVTVRVYVPVSLRRTIHGPQEGTNIAQMAVPLRLDDAAPSVRLRGIAAETRARKARPRPPLGKLFRGRLATRILLKAVVAQRVNVTTASIPGPRRRLYLAGAPVLEVFPVLPLLGNEPLGVGAVSYAGTLGIGIAADRDALPDIAVFASGVRAELAALAALQRSTSAVVDAPVAAGAGGTP